MAVKLEGDLSAAPLFAEDIALVSLALSAKRLVDLLERVVATVEAEKKPRDPRG